MEGPSIRKSWDECFLNVAKEIATMGTCVRRQVGCVLTNENNKILSTGFNGVPPGWDHCRFDPDHRCPGADAPSGTNLNGCYANHAEQNALAHCADRFKIHTCYCTASPCVICVKELLHSSCCRIVFLEEYTQPEAKDLWIKYSLLIKTRTGMISGPRTWEQLKLTSAHFPEPFMRAHILGSSGLR